MHHLSEKEKAKFISTKFQQVTKVKALPAKVAEDLGVSGNGDIIMADVGGKWGAGCVGAGDLPRQRLILAGTSTDRCVVYFERGGIAHFEILRLYDLSGDEAQPIWEFRGLKRFANIDAIKQAIGRGEFNQ